MKQTSVRVPYEAVEALNTRAAVLGVSRDAALREALKTFVDQQLELETEERLTHLTTVLKYPPMPLGRGTPDPRAHLRFRVDPDLHAAANDLGFWLPGQSRRHGHHEYAARTLTDTVITAIYQAESFVVIGLERLPQTLTQRMALGLWRLAVAATLTGAETQALWRSGNADLAVVLNEEEVAWHHPWRFAVAQHILTTLLADDDAEEWLEMLQTQTSQYQTLLKNLRQRHSDAAWLQDDICSLDTHRNSVEGRGGTAVWRAERTLEMNRIERWLADPKSAQELELTTPEWKLRWPEEWTKACFTHGEPIPAKLTTYAKRGKVCVAIAGSRSAYWPLTATGSPVEEFAACLTADRELSPAQLAEVVLLDHADLPLPGLPANQAHKLGFITEEQRDDLVATAAASNIEMIAATLKRASTQLDADELAELHAATGDPRKFIRLANRHHLDCWYANDWWRWPIKSVVEGVREGHSAARVRTLTEAYIDITARELEMAMEHAWRRAFGLGRARPD